MTRESPGPVYRLTGHPEDGKERSHLRLDLLKLVADAFGALAAPRAAAANDHSSAHSAERVEQALHACVGCVGAAGTQMQEVGKQEADDAGEHVDVQFLIRPVVLGTKGQVSRVLEMSEDGLDCGLPVVGADNLRRGPVVTAGHQDHAAERVAGQCVEGGLVEFVAEAEVGICSSESEAEDFGEVLASLEVVFDVSLDSGAVAPLLATAERVRLLR